MTQRSFAHPLATVFGGAGFIGRHMVQRLAAQGWRVRVATRDPEGAAYLRPRGDVGQVEPVFADLSKEYSIVAAVERADLVINLVGILFERGRQRFSALHRDGAARVADAARAAGVKQLVHMSALGAEAGSESSYASSKAAGERAVLASFPSAVILRPSVVFGPEDDFFNRFAALSTFAPFLPVFVSDGFKWRGLSLDLFGSGGTKFQPVFVGDVADAAMAVLAPGHQGKVYELTGPKVYSFKQLMELTLSAVGRERPLLPLPMALAKLQAVFLQFLPTPPLTPDQVKLLAHDNVATGTLPGLAELGIDPQAAEVVLPTYLSRYKNPYLFSRRA